MVRFEEQEGGSSKPRRVPVSGLGPVTWRAGLNWGSRAWGYLRVVLQQRWELGSQASQVLSPACVVMDRQCPTSCLHGVLLYAVGSLSPCFVSPGPSGGQESTPRFLKISKEL